MNVNKALDKAWKGKSFKEVADAPISAFSGLTDKDAEVLAQVLGVKTIRDLAANKYVKWASSIAGAAELED